MAALPRQLRRRLVTSTPAGATDTTGLIDTVLAAVEGSGTTEGFNIVAFSGGVDSSVVAALVHRAFPDRSVACTGISAALPEAQLALAREVAGQIGIATTEVRTNEGHHPDYVANAGMACFHCKSELYATLEAVADFASVQGAAASPPTTPGGPRARRAVVLFNGTNAEDRMDPTRVGLKAAANFQVASPIQALSKDQVRAVARALGLPNWNHAASPCLRSRLALGVLATSDALRRVEQAESFVRDVVALDVHHNLRVRTLANQRAVVEVDAELLGEVQAQLTEDHRNTILGLGFNTLEVRAFRSGSVNGTLANKNGVTITAA